MLFRSDVEIVMCLLAWPTIVKNPWHSRVAVVQRMSSFFDKRTGSRESSSEGEQKQYIFLWNPEKETGFEPEQIMEGRGADMDRVAVERSREWIVEKTVSRYVYQRV